uniref:Uncharacterized protein n=1 Tax=Arundo donax TaxID=35708 RepID=A0A0A9FLB2_ARUDO
MGRGREGDDHPWTVTYIEVRAQPRRGRGAVALPTHTERTLGPRCQPRCRRRQRPQLPRRICVLSVRVAS